MEINKCRKVREPNREPGTEPREPETAQKPAVGKPNRTEPLMYKIRSRTGRTGGRNRMRTAGMCSVCFSQANVPFNLCPRIGFVFFWKPQKKAKTQPLCPPIGFAFWALLLDLLFLEAPKKQKHNPCARLLDLFFLKAPKKQQHNPCALLLDLLFWQPPKSKNNALLLDLLFWQPQKSKNKTLVPSYCICFFWKPQKSKKNWCPRIGCAFSKATKKKKHNTYAKHKHNPCALVLDLLF